MYKKFFLKCIRNVWTSKSKILKSTNKTPVESRVSNQVSMGRKLGFRVCRSTTRVTGGHIHTRENLFSKVRLIEEKTPSRPSNTNAKEKRERNKFSHRIFG